MTTPPPVFHVTCDSCGAEGWSLDTGPGDLDDAVRCASPAGEPAGSVDGCCSTAGHTHEEHVAHVRQHADASGRPVTVTFGYAGQAQLGAGG